MVLLGEREESALAIRIAHNSNIPITLSQKKSWLIAEAPLSLCGEVTTAAGMETKKPKRDADRTKK